MTGALGVRKALELDVIGAVTDSVPSGSRTRCATRSYRTFTRGPSEARRANRVTTHLQLRFRIVLGDDSAHKLEVVR